MFQYIARRLISMIPVIFGASAIIFILLRVIPGDPASLAQGDYARAETIEALRKEWGLDQPIYIQYGKWLKSALVLDFGRSMQTSQTVLNLISARLPYSVYLGSVSIFFSLVIAIPLGILSATKRNTIVDYVCMSIAIMGTSMPSFWLGLMFMLLGGFYLGLFPVSGFMGAFFSLRGIQSVCLPAITLGVYFTAVTARMTRSSMLEVIRQDYIRTAKAKGVSRLSVLFSHALPNALIPVVTVVGTQASILFGGVILTETVFAWPGIGTLFYGAVISRDYPTVQGIALLTVMGVLILNIVVDISYALINPRVQYE